MIIDAHAHTASPPSLAGYKAGLLSHRGRPWARQGPLQRRAASASLAPRRNGARRTHGAYGLLRHRRAAHLAAAIPDHAFGETGLLGGVVHPRGQPHHPRQRETVPGQDHRRGRAAPAGGRAGRCGLRGDGALREGVRLQGLPDEPGPVRERWQRGAGAGRPLLVSALREGLRTGCAVAPAHGRLATPAEDAVQHALRQ